MGIMRGWGGVGQLDYGGHGGSLLNRTLIQLMWKLLLFLALLPLLAPRPPRSLLSAYTLTATRSTQLSQHCSASARSDLVSKYDSSSPVRYAHDFLLFFSVNDTLFTKFLDLDAVGVDAYLRDSPLGYATYIVPAYVGLALLVLLGPLMLVCLCCPSSCCLRPKLQYTNCEKGWPLVVLAVLALTVVACCVAGILSDFKLAKGFDQIACSGVLAMDDALYGNVNQDESKYFAGVSTIAAQLKVLKQNLNIIYGNLSSVGSTSGVVADAGSKLDAAMNGVGSIPDPSKGSLTLMYYTPIGASVPSSTIPSTFPALLGSMSQPDTLVYNSYVSLNESKRQLDNSSKTVDAFQSTSTFLQTNINQLIKDASTCQDSLFQSLVTINDILVTQDYPNSLTYVENLFYGIILGLTAVLLICACCFSCCSKLWCRSCIYLLGLLLFLATVCAFASFGFLSYITPIMYSGCQYLLTTGGSQNAFIKNMQKMGIDGVVAEQFSVCLKSGSGEIVSELSGEQNRAYLRLLQNVVSNLTAFDGVALSLDISRTYLPLETNVPNYAAARTLDLNDAASVAIIKKVSDASQYNCSSVSFKSDSWIPALNQTDNAIACLSSNQTQTSVCSASNFASSSNCGGCMSTSSLLANFTFSGQVYSYLATRYDNCSTFNDELSNVWQNFYKVKRDVLSPVLDREANARKAVATARAILAGNIQPLYTDTLAKLYSSSKTILLPKYGVLSGLNCQLVGDDLKLFQQSACNNTFSYAYFHRILALILAFCLLFLLCCNTCVLFRSRKEILEAQIEQPPLVRAHAVDHNPLSDARLEPYRL